MISPTELCRDPGLADPYPLFDRMRAESAVHQIGNSTFFAVCSRDAVLEAIERTADFSSNLTATMVYNADTGSVTPFTMAPLDDPSHALAIADDPVHAVHRKLLIGYLSAKRIRAIEEFATETAARLWDEGLADGRIEWMGALANKLPMMVVAELIGIPADDVDQLIEWGYATTTLLDGVVSPEQLQAAGIAAIELSGYVMEHFQQAQTRRASGLLADLAARTSNGELEQTTALGIMLTLFSAGGESTSSLLGSAAWILATRREVQQQLRENPELLGAFIEETLRCEPPFRAHYRHVRRDTTLAGVALPADARLLLMWGAANRDPMHVESPAEFRLDRTNNKNHLSFGKGAHFCVGAALARLEARIVLGMLLERTTEISAVDIGPWQPSMLVRRLQHLELTVR